MAEQAQNQAAVEIAGKLTEAQRTRLLTFRAAPRQLGIGMVYFLPDLVEPENFGHPCFGPHHYLTPLGEAVRALLERERSQP